VDKSNEDAHQF
jgi:cytosolic carboxypeptidase protein 5